MCGVWGQGVPHQDAVARAGPPARGRGVDGGEQEEEEGMWSVNRSYSRVVIINTAHSFCVLLNQTH